MGVSTGYSFPQNTFTNPYTQITHSSLNSKIQKNNSYNMYSVPDANSDVWFSRNIIENQ